MRKIIKPESPTSTRGPTIVEARLGIPEVFIEHGGQRRRLSIVEAESARHELTGGGAIEIGGQRHEFPPFEARVISFSILQGIAVAGNSSTTAPDDEEIASHDEDDEDVELPSQ